jgi:hypothetical protein
MLRAKRGSPQCGDNPWQAKLMNSQKSKGFSVTREEYIAEQWPGKVLDGLPSRPDRKNP